MADSFEAKVKVAVDAEQAKQQVGYLKTMMNQFSTEVTNRFVAIFSAAAVVKMGFDKVSQAMAHNLQIAKQISSLSSKFHIDPKQVHSIMMSAEQAGVSVRQLLMGMKSLGAAASKAVVNKEFANAFKTMGMDASKLGDMATKPAKAFGEVALKLSEIASETLRAEVGTKLLGRSYQQLAPLIDKLSESEEERKKFLNNENAMTGSQVNQAKVYAKGQAEMKEGFEHMVANFMPVFQIMASVLQLILNGIMLLFNWAVNKFAKSDVETTMAAQAAANPRRHYSAEFTAEAFNTDPTKRTERQRDAIRGDALEDTAEKRAANQRQKLENWSEADEVAYKSAVAAYNNNEDGGFGKGMRGSRYGHAIMNQETIHAGETKARKDTEVEKRARFKKLLDSIPKNDKGEYDLDSTFFDVGDADLKGGLVTMAKLHNAAKKGGMAGAAKTGNAILNEGESAYDKKQEALMKDNKRQWYKMKNAILSGDPKNKNQWVEDENGNWSLQDTDIIKKENRKPIAVTDFTMTDEKQKKRMKGAQKKADMAKRALALSKLDYYDEVGHAELALTGAELDVEKAEDEHAPKDKEKTDAQAALFRAEEAERKAREKDAAEGYKSKTTQQEVKDAADATVVAKNALNAATAEALATETALTQARTKEADAIDRVRKATESMQGKKLGETNEERSEKEELERKDFERSQKDKKLMGTPQQDLSQAQLDFDKKIMERRVKEFNDYFKAATERAKANKGHLSDVDRAELVKKQKAVTNAKEKVEDSLYGMMHPSSMVVSDMRKIGGGGGVFGTPDVGMSVIEANRKKIPLLEAIEKNTRGVYVQGVRGAIDDSSLRPDNSPPINSR